MRSRMLAWLPFIRTAAVENAQKSADGFVPYKSAEELLATPRRQLLLENIWHRMSVNREQFNKFYLGPIKRYAEIVQQLPASVHFRTGEELWFYIMAADTKHVITSKPNPQRCSVNGPPSRIQ